MSKSIAELRASHRTALPERTYELCLSQALVGEVQALVEEKRSLEVASARAADEDNTDGPVKRLGQGKDPRIAEIDARLEELYDEMREHTGKLLLRGETGGEWQRWCDKNPPREDGRDERGRRVVLALDDTVAYGLCDASALMARLGDFAVSWNGEELQTGDWDWLREKAPPGDLKEMARWIVQMHETNGIKPLPGKSRSGSSETAPSETA